MATDLKGYWLWQENGRVGVLPYLADVLVLNSSRNERPSMMHYDVIRIAHVSIKCMA